MSDLPHVDFYRRIAAFLSKQDAEPLPHRLARKFLVELNPLIPHRTRRSWGTRLRERVMARRRSLFDARLRAKLAALREHGGVHTFSEGGRAVRMVLPQAQGDFVQRRVLMENRFFELHFLERTNRYLPRGSNVVDVGANIGNHALYWAIQSQVALLVAFEPVPPTFETLTKNVRLNELQRRIDLRPVAVGSSPGAMEIFVPEGNPCLSRLENDFSVNLDGAPDVRAYPVHAVTLNEACRDLNRLDLLKIDVEGFEEDVLLGADELLRRFRPALMIEVWPERRARLEQLIGPLGYRIDQELDENNVIYVAV